MLVVGRVGGGMDRGDHGLGPRPGEIGRHRQMSLVVLGHPHPVVHMRFGAIGKREPFEVCGRPPQGAQVVTAGEVEERRLTAHEGVVMPRDAGCRDGAERGTGDAPVSANSSDTSPASIAARASPSRIRASERSQAAVDAAPSARPTPRVCAACTTITANAAS
jgi:hypothetical protein